MRDEFPLYQVDVFSKGPFAGNPAAVCILHQPMSNEWMQAVAAEMNLSETAFVMVGEGSTKLRWFTPVVEVPLCGHATIAAAHVLWKTERLSGAKIVFNTVSGQLTARRQGEIIDLDLPASWGKTLDDPAQVPEQVLALVGEASVLHAEEHGQGSTYLLGLESAEAVTQLQPRLTGLRHQGAPGVIVTAMANKEEEHQIVSRYFHPGIGIDEDPVTGYAHSCIGTFWSRRTGQTRFKCYQASARGGHVQVRVTSDTVNIRGRVYMVFAGTFFDKGGPPPGQDDAAGQAPEAAQADG